MRRNLFSPQRREGTKKLRSHGSRDGGSHLRRKDGAGRGRGKERPCGKRIPAFTGGARGADRRAERGSAREAARAAKSSGRPQRRTGSGIRSAPGREFSELRFRRSQPRRSFRSALPGGEPEGGDTDTVRSGTGL